MDLANIRADLAEAVEGFEFHVYDNVLTVPQLPAIMVGMPVSIEFSSLRDCKLTIPLHVMVNMADSEDAQNRLSIALTNRRDSESVLDAIRTAKSDYWKALVVTGVSNFALIPEFSDALSCDITVELISADPPTSPGS